MSFGKKHEDKVLASGTKLPMLDLRGKPYLQVAHRLVWFREEMPEAAIETVAVSITDTSAVFKATIKRPTGEVLAVAHKKETEDGFPDFIEKAETGAIGRALAMCGYGTQFAPEFDEEDRLADSPVEPSKKGGSSGKKVAGQPKGGARNSVGAGNDASGSVSNVSELPKRTDPNPKGRDPGSEDGAETSGSVEEIAMKTVSLARVVVSLKLADVPTLQAFVAEKYKVEAAGKLSEQIGKLDKASVEDFCGYLEEMKNKGAA